MKINFKNKTGGSKKGFVVLFTVLIASVVLTMALGIANIALKQIVLTASATDANKSFYAADTGIECALYYDLKVIPSAFTIGSPAPISCGVETALFVSETAGYFTFEFNMPTVDGSGDSCATVSVDKTISNQTVVTSRGTNNLCGFPTARTVERVIEVTY